LNEDQIAERGARLARRDDREYREYLREEQRRQMECPAREVVRDQRIQATSGVRAVFRFSFQRLRDARRIHQIPGATHCVAAARPTQCSRRAISGSLDTEDPGHHP
jgi:hypothetical protein